MQELRRSGALAPSSLVHQQQSAPRPTAVRALSDLPVGTQAFRPEANERAERLSQQGGGSSGQRSATDKVGGAWSPLDGKQLQPSHLLADI